jgi:hypothetical protein
VIRGLDARSIFFQDFFVVVVIGVVLKLYVSVMVCLHLALCVVICLHLTLMIILVWSRGEQL